MIKNQECALMNVCQNTCALGRLVPLRNSADDPRCIVALLFSLTCLLSTPFTLDLLIHLFQVLHFVLPATCSYSTLLFTLRSFPYSSFAFPLLFPSLFLLFSSLLIFTLLYLSLSSLLQTLLFIALLVFCSFSPHLSMPQSSANHLGGFEMHLIESYRFRCANIDPGKPAAEVSQT